MAEPMQTSGIDTKRTFEELMGVKRPYLERTAEARKAVAGAEADIAQATQAQAEAKAGAAVEPTRQYVSDVQSAQQQYEQKKAAEPMPAFVPTRDNAEDLAKLFSFIGVAGTFLGRGGGKQAAMGAMAGMTGMMEGWRQGRMDLYNQEKVKFEKDFARVQKLHQDLAKDLETAIKTAATNKELGIRLAEEAAVRAGSDIVKAQIKKGNLVAGYESSKEMLDAVNKASAQVERLKEADIRAQAQVAAARERATGAGAAGAGWKAFQSKSGKIIRYNMRTGEIEGGTADDLIGATQVGTSPKGFTQQVAIAQRAVNALGGVASAVETIVELPEGSTTGWLPNLQTKDGMTNAIRNFLGRKISNVDAEFMNTIFSGLGRNLATIESSGLASGLTTLANQLQSGVYINAGVDDPYKVAMKLADIRRVAVENIQPAIDSGLMPEQQAETARKLVKRIEEVIPYSTLDVAKAYNQSKGTKSTIGKSTTKAVPAPDSVWTEENERRLRELEGKSRAVK